jgi:hypothetical protein
MDIHVDTLEEREAQTAAERLDLIYDVARTKMHYVRVRQVDGADIHRTCQDHVLLVRGLDRQCSLLSGCVGRWPLCVCDPSGCVGLPAPEHGYVDLH